MKQKLLFFLIFVNLISSSFGQKSKKSLLSPTKFGFELTQGNERSILFDDPDYFYRTNTLKLQFYYPLTHWKKLEFSLVIQPQIQSIQHQLYNEQFIRPTDKNYLINRERFTKLKNLSLYAVEFGIETKVILFKDLYLFLNLGLGFGIIDTETERLAKGFTFIENGNLGIEIQISTNTALHFFGGVGHVSNLNFQSPNAGYNVFNTGIGINVSLQ